VRPRKRFHGEVLATWMLLYPSLTLVAILFCLNFIGDGLRDALDPKDR
jgi:oligopeptide transport system permease protein